MLLDGLDRLMTVRFSTIRMFESGHYRDAVLLVDGGYASTHYMMPPLENPRDPQEHLYNEAQIRTRNCVERMFGVWKRRFPVLARFLGFRLI